MISLPNGRRNTASHVGVTPDGDYLVVGITEHAEEALSSIEVVDLPAIGSNLSSHSPCGSVESLKSVSDLVAAFDARVISHNTTVRADPGMVNEQPYEEGWLMTLGDYRQRRSTACWTPRITHA